MDTRLPHFDGQKDFLAFVRFLDNRKEFDGYIKLLDKKIAAFVEATAVYGKAKEINKLHDLAEAVIADANAKFQSREDNLAEGETMAAQQAKAQRDDLGTREAKVVKGERELSSSCKSFEADMKSRQTEVLKQENALVARGNRLNTAIEDAKTQSAEAVVAKKNYDDLVHRIKSATGPQEAHPAGG